MIIIAVTVVSYWHIMSNLEWQVIEQLDKYITERGQRESNLFILSEDNHAIYKKEFLSQLKQMGNEIPRERFHKIFQAQEDGTMRMHPQFFMVSSNQKVVSSLKDLPGLLVKTLSLLMILSVVSS
ncbi:hypothetical protein BGP_3692 [Beggiatoa sp. PS]|nr:hypothetical protein BGP_3692 [Beggiatoa sp. PS]